VVGARRHTFEIEAKRQRSWRAIVFRYVRRIVARKRNEPDVLRPELAVPGPGAPSHKGLRRPRHVDDHLVEFGMGAASAPCEEHTASPPVSSHHVTVLLNQGEVYAHPGDGYEPLSGYVMAIDFIVEAISAAAACEVAYGVTNSYPWELHCEAKYLDVVRTYREVGHFRSVTVGDIFVVNEERFVCSHFGFFQSPWMNGMV
jgi:hypothetical protein